MVVDYPIFKNFYLDIDILQIITHRSHLCQLRVHSTDVSHLIKANCLGIIDLHKNTLKCG